MTKNILGPIKGKFKITVVDLSNNTAIIDGYEVDAIAWELKRDLKPHCNFGSFTPSSIRQSGPELLTISATADTHYKFNEEQEKLDGR